MSLVKRMKSIDYRHYILIMVTAGFVVYSALCFPNAFGRILESFRDLGLSAAYYFCELFGIDNNITPTITTLPKIPFFADETASVLPSVIVPETSGEFADKWHAYWRLFANADNFFGYVGYLGNIIYIICQVFLFSVPVVVLIAVLFKRFLRAENNDYNADSKPLKYWRRFEKRVYCPVKRWLYGLVAFTCNRRYYLYIWLILAAYSLNVITIVIEFVAFYLYFVMSFDVLHIYLQIYKLFLDLAAFVNVPWWIWGIVAIVVFDVMRKRVALAVLNHHERRNRGFLNARPLVLMACGSMGKKKTTIITDMALSQNVMFRDKAFELILENDLKFPFFPWINFENALKQAIERGSVYNLATCKRFVRSKYKKFLRRPVSYYCFGYDFCRYGLTYDDKLKIFSLWDVLESYAQLYFIYIMESSLLVSNYSIRTDEILSDFGNFPLWNTDFFRRDSRLIDCYSRHAHILDFDSLRLGCKVVEDNRLRDSFEFGVVVITEIGKERKNNLETQGMKSSDEGANQKNDYFNMRLKMIRHSATVDNFPFVRVITDEQRPESWGADARDLCDVIQIVESSETRLAMPFFMLGELICPWVYRKFSEMYSEYRYSRGDNTLLMYFIHGLAAGVHRYYNRIYNQFGYCAVDLDVEGGRMDGKPVSATYYLAAKKIYSKRFSTDCFSDYFARKAMRSSVGLNGVPEYRTERADTEELQQQHSYFVADMDKYDNDGYGNAERGRKRKDKTR